MELERMGEKKFSPSFFISCDTKGGSPMTTAMSYRNMAVGISDEPRYHPEQKELDRVGKGGFRCFSCLERKSKKHFGGIRTNVAICDVCYPATDDLEIAGYIAFDKYHGFGFG